MLNLQLVKIVEESLVKARSHKYIKRVPYINPNTGKKKYRYYYKLPTRGSLVSSSSLVVGASFAYGTNDEEGYYSITALDGDQVTVRHDKTNDTRTLSIDTLKDLLKQDRVSETSSRSSSQTQSDEARDMGVDYNAVQQTVRKRLRNARAVQSTQAPLNDEEKSYYNNAHRSSFKCEMFLQELESGNLSFDEEKETVEKLELWMRILGSSVYDLSTLLRLRDSEPKELKEVKKLELATAKRINKFYTKPMNEAEKQQAAATKATMKSIQQSLRKKHTLASFRDETSTLISTLNNNVADLEKKWAHSTNTTKLRFLRSIRTLLEKVNEKKRLLRQSESGSKATSQESQQEALREYEERDKAWLDQYDGKKLKLNTTKKVEQFFEDNFGQILKDIAVFSPYKLDVSHTETYAGMVLASDWEQHLTPEEQSKVNSIKPPNIQVSRNIDRHYSTGALDFHNGYMKVDNVPDDFATQFYLRQEDFFKSITSGLSDEDKRTSMITINADIDVGKYMWAKQGYVYDTPRSRKAHASELINSFGQVFEERNGTFYFKTSSYEYATVKRIKINGEDIEGESVESFGIDPEELRSIKALLMEATSNPDSDFEPMDLITHPCSSFKCDMKTDDSGKSIPIPHISKLLLLNADSWYAKKELHTDNEKYQKIFALADQERARMAARAKKRGKPWKGL